MPIRNRLIVLGFLALAAPSGHAEGEIYKCPDASGRPTYTNVKRDTVGKHCTLVSREVSVIPSPARSAERAGAPKSGDSPKSGESSSERADNRRTILAAELAREQKLLADAQQQLAQQQSVRSGNERNYARVLERLKPYQEQVARHQTNVDELKRALDGVK